MTMHLRSLSLLALGLVVGCYQGNQDMPADTDGETDGGTDTADDGADSSGDDGVPEDLEPGSVDAPLATRLNDTQYGYTVLDVLGTELNEQEWGWLPHDVPIEGAYSTSAQTQFFNTQYVLGYAYIARSLSERLDATALLQEHGGCGDVEAACLEAFVDGLGLRAFRRPLTGDERAAFLELADTIAADADTTDEHVVQGVVQMMLQSPPFLYRLEGERDGEPGEVRRVTGYELASRLSYFLWQSAPDDELLAFAAGPEGDGAYDGAALPEQIDRMIADGRFARSRRIFWGDYSLATVAPFGSVSPDVAEQLRESLLASLERISGVGAEPVGLQALLDGNELVMTPDVAELAGVESQGDGLQVYEDVPERHGVITHPAFLAAIGTTSFVGRGVFMTERVLCQHTAAPPSDDQSAAAIEDTANSTADMTPREASEFRFELEPVCLACHHQFEPIAYAFERYDMSGRHGLTDEEGRDLYSDGVLPAFGDRPEIPFDGPAVLLDALAGRPEIDRCMVENMMEYAAGSRPVGAEEFVEQAHGGYEAGGFTFDALVQSVAGNDRLTFLRTVE